MSWHIFYKILKFCLVGFTGMVIDFGLTYLFKEKLKVDKFLANSIGFSAAATNNYYLNRIWTFESTNQNISKEYSLFVGFALIGLLINNSVIYVLNEKLNMNFYFSKVLAIVVTVVWNFGANFLFNFQ